MRSLVGALYLHTSCKYLGQSLLHADRDLGTVSLEVVLVTHWKAVCVFHVIVASYCSFDLGYFYQGQVVACGLVCCLV